LQNLHYTYDPAGNITHIRDDAQQGIYFGGQVVPPHCDYTYDAIYRLIGATGREHIGQVGQPETTWNDEVRVRLPHPGDGQAMRNYAEYYEYDAVGNFEKLMHQAANGSWTRSYAYSEASLLEPAKQSNRLSSTAIGSGPPETYLYDAHGNMAQMNHLSLIQWDYRNQLQATAQQVVNSGSPETTWYIYDASGQRMRKVTELVTGRLKNEHIYLGGFEIYRRQGGNALARETLHVMDDKQRIALVETRTQGNEPGVPQQLIRYQCGNHLGSASLELDHQAQIISYEEYYSYGSTSYQAVRSQTETPRRYRYTGKERDEETGLYYHGARYYAAWLGRWISCDPVELVDETNRYLYVRGNSLTYKDPTGFAGEQENYTKAGITEARKVIREIKKKGLEAIEEVWISQKLRVDALIGKGRDVLELFEHKLINLTTQKYRLKSGALSEKALVSRLKEYFEQAYKYSIEAIEGDLVNTRTGKPLSTRLVLSLKGSKEELQQAQKVIEQTAKEYRAIFRELAEDIGSEYVPEVTTVVRDVKGGSKALGRTSRWAGLVGTGIGLAIGFQSVAEASPEERPAVITEETGSFIGSAAFGAVGTAAGTAAAGGIAVALGLSGPPGWLVGLLAIIGGGAGGYFGGEVGGEGGRALSASYKEQLNYWGQEWERKLGRPLTPEEYGDLARRLFDPRY
jgi:RHS repeat-associated protein